MEKKDIIVIGGSAGSIEVMLAILPGIPENFPIPIVVVLHRKNNNENITESIFQSRCKIPVIEAEDKMQIKSGVVYLAPCGYHLLIERNGTFSLDSSEKVNYSRPSIDVTMESILDIYKNKIIGILLTGANDDGAKGMQLIKNGGGMTIIQSPESAMMPIMPMAAENLIKPDKILNPLEISEFLANISQQKCSCCN